MKQEPLSENEDIANGRAMVAAALRAFGPSIELENFEQNGVAKKIIAAMSAANKQQQAAKGRTSTEVDSAVATAYYMWTNGIDNVLDTHPSSIVGDQLVAFARGMAAAHLLSEARAMLGDNETDSPSFSPYGCGKWSAA